MMQIILHHPQFALMGTIGGTLMGRHTISLVVDTEVGTAGVITLDHVDVLRIMPQLRRFLELGPPDE